MTPEVKAGGESRSAREAARDWLGEQTPDVLVNSLAALLESHAASHANRVRQVVQTVLEESTRVPPAKGNKVAVRALAMAAREIDGRLAGGGTVRPGQERA